MLVGYYRVLPGRQVRAIITGFHPRFSEVKFAIARRKAEDDWSQSPLGTHPHRGLCPGVLICKLILGIFTLRAIY
jgi:hypothetical protein